MRSNQESWAKTTFWLTLANVLRNVGLILVLLFLAQLTDPETVGRYALALAITTPMFAFAQFGLRGVYLTLRARVGLPSYLIVQTAGVLGATGVSVAIAAVADPSLIVTVLLVSVFKSADAYCELLSAPLQQHGRPDLVFWGFLTFAVVGGAAVGWGLAATKELDIALLSMAAVSVLVTFFLFALPALRFARGSEALEHEAGAVRTVLRAGLPTGLSLSVLALIPTIPQYILAASVGSIAVGYFVVVLYVYMAAELFTGALVQSWLPHARSRFEDLGRQRGEFFLWVFGFIVKWTVVYVPVSVAGSLMAWWVYPFLFPGYLLTISLLLPLVVTVLLLPALYFSSAAIGVWNLYSHNLTVGAIAVAIALLASIVLVPVYGVDGALWATFAGVAGRTLVAISIVILAERRAG